MTSGLQYCVVGGGIIGLWTALHLQRAGVSTLLIDQFPLPHARGSSHGGSRVWRLLGDDDPTKVVYSMKEWLNLEAQAGSKLFVQTGLLNFGPEDDPYLKLHMDVLKKRHFPTSFLTAGEVKTHYPMIRFPPEWGATWDPSGGILLATQCLVALEARFRALGGCIAHEKVTQVSSEQQGALVLSELPEGQIRRRKFRKVIVCAGPWTAQLLPQLSSHLKTVVIPVTYFREISPTNSEANTTTTFLSAPTSSTPTADPQLSTLPLDKSPFDQAADRVRYLKANMAPLKEVKEAVQAFIALELLHPGEPIAPGPVYSVSRGFPVLFNARLAGVYCVPTYEYPGMVKVVVHDGVEVAPESRDSADISGALSKVQAYVKNHLPHLEPSASIIEKCFYTLTQDNQPIMDEIAPNIIVGAGYSGSGFKYSPACGLILANLALGRAQQLPSGYQLERYQLARFSPISSL